MAISFNKTAGSAIKKGEAFTFKDGDNTFRLVGGILARYMYWLKGTNGKDIPVECLGFDREQEKFTNKEKDHVQDFFPDVKCSWAYSMLCIDPADGKVKVMNLKKKMFQQIMSAAENMGDPTDPTTGYDLIVKRTKTGPLAYNVEYTLNTFKLKPRALTEAELAAVAASETIDQRYPRQTPDEVKALLEKLSKGDDGGDADESTKEAVQDLQ